MNEIKIDDIVICNCSDDIANFLKQYKEGGQLTDFETSYKTNPFPKGVNQLGGEISVDEGSFTITIKIKYQ